MAREDFLVNLRNAAYFLDLTAQDRQPLRGGRFNKAMLGIPVWLKQETVAGFDAGDFAELTVSERRELQQEVDHFLAIARIAPSGPFARNSASAETTREPIRKALAHIQRIVALTGKAVLAEWMAALERFLQEAETWALERDWAVKRDMKELNDGMLGTYDVPRLLIHTLENQRYFLDPVGREIVSATGRVDLSMMPSYDSIGIIRGEKGWYVLPDLSPARRRPWTRGVFYRTLDKLANAA